MSKNNYYKNYIPEEEVTEEEVNTSEEVEEVVEETEEVKEEAVEEVVEEVKEEVPVVSVEKGSTFKGFVDGTDKLNVRKSPMNEIVMIIDNGSEVTIEGEEGDWYRISAPVAGYVMKKFIRA